MPKSYKLCPVRDFNVSRFSEEPLPLKPQYVLDIAEKPPETRIFRARDHVSLEDFEGFVIEHEQEWSVRGRVNGHAFDKFIRKGTMRAYFSPAKSLLLLTGKKDDILDFCKISPTLDGISISTIKVDMRALLAKLSEVKLVWFRFPAGLIRASALMGSHIQRTDQFADAHAEGEISTLSFHFESSAGVHPIMITTDGAIVLQDDYREISDEIEIVTEIKALLLDGIFVEQPIKSAKAAFPR